MDIKFIIEDIVNFFKKNQKVFFTFLIFLTLGLVVGIIIAFSSDSYLSLLTTSNKTFFDYVNGKVDFSKQATNLILSSLFLQGIFFLLSIIKLI